MGLGNPACVGFDSVKATSDVPADVRRATARLNALTSACPGRRFENIAVFPRQRRILEHLRLEIARIRNRDVDDVTAVVAPGLEPRHDKPGVRRELESIDARNHFVAEGAIEMDAVLLEQAARRRVVTLALDPLN